MSRMTSRLNKLEQAAQAKTSSGKVVFALNHPCRGGDLYSCPEFDGRRVDCLHIFQEDDAAYHWTLTELKAEAARRGGELSLIVFVDEAAPGDAGGSETIDKDGAQ